MPLRLFDSLRRESAEWRIRCDACGREKSLLAAGGVRWKARGVVHTVGWCTGCGGLRGMTIHHPTRDPLPNAAPPPAGGPATPSPPK